MAVIHGQFLRLDQEHRRRIPCTLNAFLLLYKNSVLVFMLMHGRLFLYCNDFNKFY
jgi:hypothetical protein